MPKPDIGRESRFLPISPTFDAPVIEGCRILYSPSERLVWKNYDAVCYAIG